MDGTAFLARVEAYRQAGWRLALINATTVMAAEGEGGEEAFELAWGFAREGEFELIRETVRSGEEVPSVSGFFGAAFLYENELRELFGIEVTGIDVDLKGQLYKTATRIPFSHRAVRERLEASGGAGPGKAHS
jgi:ech hydrogenase subunit D